MDIADELLISAKKVAAQRRTTLKSLMEHALRREIMPLASESSSDKQRCFEINPQGLPVLKRQKRTQITSAQIYQMMEDEGI